MMLGVSGLIATSAADNHESGGASGGSSEVGASSSALAGGVDESERVGQGGGGNRWPRQETLALLKIRSDMDVTFRDASLKGPLWEEVSRKLAELGFQRSAKKCKEKFENVFKYHKRTKDGRASKQDAKAYRFFDQLEALENTSPNNHHFSPPPPPRLQPPPSVAMVSTAATPMPSHVTVPSASPTPLSVVPPKNIATVHPITSSPFQQSHQPQPQPQQQLPPYPHPLSNSTSSSTSSDEDIQRRRGRKRKWKEYFEKLMTDVVQKQEELQKKFLEALERRERDRITREEAWRVQETARMNREHDILVQERSLAAAKDSAVISFLQKVTGQTNLQIPTTNNIIAPPQPSMPPPPQQTSLPPPPELQSTPTKTLDITPHRDNGGGGDDHISPSSSRWPKAEVEALIKLRKDLEVKYQENGPKGPLWEEISKAMSNIGYNRSSKRCKEKWENINKYFKKVKESNKKRPQDSKTCPYFHQLDAIYKERAKNHVPSFNLGPIMARPEQQWPQQQQQSMHQDNESENHEGGGEEEDDNDDDDDDDVGDYEMIATKQPSSVTNTVEGG
ncbi:trihelix transcription factor DF1-like [Salvia miltiorrhiza]|uniref:trihelix transcription factor DF1-like n=1 Tax=Salvia miltiorrhiza TaxID=226208 RepID=UPI0025AB6BD4|nr:trihelix transcription factor DF1-like [Salvia miltiorrhiza]